MGPACGVLRERASTAAQSADLADRRVDTIGLHLRVVLVLFGEGTPQAFLRSIEGDGALQGAAGLQAVKLDAQPNQGLDPARTPVRIACEPRRRRARAVLISESAMLVSMWRSPVMSRMTPWLRCAARR